MVLANKLTDMLGIEYPILQAPMGGQATPAMAAAVTNAGGLGGFGCSYFSVDEISTAVEAIRADTDGPFNLNFFTHNEPRPGRELDPRLQQRLDAFYDELGIEEIPEIQEIACYSFDGERLNQLLAIRPRVVSFHFGLPPLEMVRVLQESGIIVIGCATTVAEAVWLDEAGADAIIAQGWEAGGHRGSFDLTGADFGVGTMALVPQIVDRVRKPVIAAGGIADGRGVAAALVLGAQGVQLGTAFLSCPEANIDDGWRESIRNASADETRLCKAFSGRPARGKDNRYVEAMAREHLPLPDFPQMYRYSYPLEKAAAEQQKSGFECHIYGQAAPLNRELPAAELVARLVEETRAALSAAGK